MKELIIRRLKVIRARILALCLFIIFASFLAKNGEQKSITIDNINGRGFIAKEEKNGQHKRH